MSLSRTVSLTIVTAAIVAAGLGSMRDASAQRGTLDAGRRTAATRALDAGRRDTGIDATRTDAAVASIDARTAPLRTQCPDGMRLVDGEYCPQVDQRCLRWLDPDEEFPMRCAEFAPTRCISRRRHVSVCMDEYEYPNHPGAFPQVMVSWYAARRACEARGARLCSMAEWTFACEGEQMLPYPYGLQRDETACNFDHQTMRPDRSRLSNPATSADESARLYEAVPSGQYNRCVSPLGIHDMTGNADEWVNNETGHPFQSALKGGWWGPIRGRCRPTTLAHNEGFVYYQIGFRCCADPT